MKAESSKCQADERTSFFSFLFPCRLTMLTLTPRSFSAFFPRASASNPLSGATFETQRQLQEGRGEGHFDS